MVATLRVVEQVDRRSLGGDALSLAELVSKAFQIPKGEARRLVIQGQVRVDGERENQISQMVSVKTGMTLELGTRRKVILRG